MSHEIDSNATLWQNVQALMVKHYGKENLSRLALDCSIGLGTAGRIKEQKTSVGIGVMDKIAAHFNLAAWQLLVPGFNPSEPPVLQPVSQTEQRLWRAVMSVAEEIAQEQQAQGLHTAAGENATVGPDLTAATSPTSPRR